MPKILGKVEGGQDGVCGNLNGNGNDDSAELISARIGMGIPPTELLFEHPWKK